MEQFENIWDYTATLQGVEATLQEVVYSRIRSRVVANTIAQGRYEFLWVFRWRQIYIKEQPGQFKQRPAHNGIENSRACETQLQARLLVGNIDCASLSIFQEAVILKETLQIIISQINNCHNSFAKI